MKICSVQGCGRKHWAKGFCLSCYNKKYYLENGDKRRVQMKKWRSENPDKHRAGTKKWRSENRERYLEQKKKYQQTFEGMLTCMYCNMKARVEGRNIREKDKKYYFGLPIVPKEEFIAWASSLPELHALYKQWQLNGYARKFKPSPDRCYKTSKNGYTKDNIEFIPCYMQQVRSNEVRKMNNAKQVYEIINVPSKAKRKTTRTQRLRPGEKSAIYNVLGVKECPGAKDNAA